MNQGSAVPNWLLQILPSWFLARPVFTEAAYTFLLSMTKASVPIILALYGIYDALPNTDPNNGLAFVTWLGHNWFGLFMGYLGGGGVASFSARNAAVKAAAAPPNPTPAAQAPQKEP